MKKEIKVTKQVAELINSHGFKTEIINHKIIPNFKDDIKIETWAYPTKQPYGIQSRLDIGVTLKNGKVLYEAFGDVGSDLDNAINNNLKSFTQSSLHIIIDAFNTETKYTVKEIWTINNSKFEVFIGNYTLKNYGKKEIVIPNNLMKTLQKSISSYNLDEEIYFARFFYGHNQNETIATEFMINNTNMEEEEKILKQLDWMKTQTYYSIRNFMILKKIQIK